ncbi:MAG: GAF domain-containing protein [Chloroflexota bacterium]
MKRKLAAQDMIGLFKSLLDTLADPIVIVNHNGVIVWVNRAWREFAVQNGGNQVTQSGEGLNYFTVCEQAEQGGDPLAGEALRGVQRVLSGNADFFTLIYPCHSPNEERWYRMGAVRLSGQEGMAVITHHNISEQVKMEAVLDEGSQQINQQRQEINLQLQALSATANGIVITDRDGNIQWINPAMTNLTGYSFEEIVGKNPRLFNSGRQDVTFYRKMWNTIISGRVWKGELINRRKDGSLYFEDMTITPLRADGKEITHFVAVKQDVSERVRQESVLYTSEERFRTLVDSLPDIVFTLDHEERHTGVYGQWLKNFNVSAEMFLGKTALDLFGAEAGEVHHLANLKALKGEDVVYDWQYSDEKGEHYIQTHLSPLRDRDNRIQGIVGVGRDITVLEQAEQRLREYARELEKLNEIAEHLIQIEDAEELYDWLTRQLAQYFQAEKVLVALVNPRNGILEAQSPAFGVADDQLKKFAYSVLDGSKVWDFRSQGALVVNHFDEIPEGFQHLADLFDVRNVLASQFIIREHFGGLVVVLNKRGSFSLQDVQFLDIVSREAGVVLARLQLYARQQAQLNELKVLHQVAVAGSVSTTEDALIARVTQITGEALFPDNFGVLLVQNDGVTLKPHPSYHGASPEAMGMAFPIGKGSIAGLTAMTGLPQRIDDVHHSEDYFDANESMSSELCVPIRLGEEILGVLNAESREAGAFSEEDERLLTTIAGLLATGIARLRREEAERQERRFAEALVASGRAVNSTLDIEEIISRIFDEIVIALPFQAAALVLFEAGKVTVAHQQGDFGVDLTEFSFYDFLLEEEPISRVQRFFLRSGKFVRWDSDHSPLVPSDEQNGLMASLKTDGNLIGAILLIHNSHSPYTSRQMSLLTSLVDQVSIALKNATLYRQTIRAAERRTALHRASKEIISAGFDLEAVFRSIHTAVQAVMPAEAFVISLLDEKEENIEAVYAVDRGGRSAPQRIAAHTGLSGQVIDANQSVLVHDTEVDKGVFAKAVHFGSPETVRSVIAVPIRRQEKAVGMLSAQSYQPNVYSPEDIELLEMLAAHVARVLENAELYQETQQRARELGALLDTTLDLAGITELDQLLEQILTRATSLLNLERGGIYLYDPDQNNLVLVATKDLGVEPGLRMEMGESMSGRVALTRKPLVIADYSAWDGRSPKYDAYHFTSSLDVPMLYHGELVGVLQVTEVYPRFHEFSQEEVDILMMFATHAAAAVKGVKLFEQTQRRLKEMEIINLVSKSVREARFLDELLTGFLKETMHALDCENGGIWLSDTSTGLIKSVAVEGWFSELGDQQQRLHEGIAGWVFEHGQPYISQEFRSDEMILEASRENIPAGWGGVAIPISTAYEVFAILFLSFPMERRIKPEEVTFLSLLCEIAGNAIHRIQLDRQMERRIDQLMSLRTIDNAINASLDLELTLNILLDQVLAQLKAEAADILLFEATTNTLRVAAWRGFRNTRFNRLRISLGYGFLSRVMTDRQLKTAPNLNDIQLDGVRDEVIRREGLVSYVALPLVAKGQNVGVLEVFHRDRRAAMKEELDFLETLGGQAAIAINNASLFEELQQTNTQLFLAYDATLEGWARALELRDNETEGHSRRVSDLTLRLARAVGVPDDELAHIRRGTLLHDIGKMGIPDEILHKPGPLTEEEWEIMKQHPQMAYHLLTPIPYLEKAIEIPYSHHERWDGSGYPRGLSGELIPLSARIFAVVDVYDALRSDRPYRKAWSEEETLQYLRHQAGVLFDPRIVEAFLKIIAQ